jgi:hypothetical protein
MLDVDLFFSKKPPHPGPLLRLRSEERETVRLFFKNNVEMHRSEIRLRFRIDLPGKAR